MHIVPPAAVVFAAAAHSVCHSMVVVAAAWIGLANGNRDPYLRTPWYSCYYYRHPASSEQAWEPYASMRRDVPLELAMHWLHELPGCT